MESGRVRSGSVLTLPPTSSRGSRPALEESFPVPLTRISQNASILLYLSHSSSTSLTACPLCLLLSTQLVSPSLLLLCLSSFLPLPHSSQQSASLLDFSPPPFNLLPATSKIFFSLTSSFLPPPLFVLSPPLLLHLLLSKSNPVQRPCDDVRLFDALFLPTNLQQATVPSSSSRWSNRWSNSDSLWSGTSSSCRAAGRS